ncbi:hypothetical protein, partial [Peribacillus frigoritolerans]|uniref:hypothetical protein n=1 Tax=Peribacillus frigoritolerans TaxID=450367 RepID=UPI002281D0F0
DTVAVIGNTDNGFHAVGEYGFPDLVGIGFVDGEKKDSLWLSQFVDKRGSELKNSDPFLKFL